MIIIIQIRSSSVFFYRQIAIYFILKSNNSKSTLHARTVRFLIHFILACNIIPLFKGNRCYFHITMKKLELTVLFSLLFLVPSFSDSDDRMKVFDLSHDLNNKTLRWPTATQFKVIPVFQGILLNKF